MTKALFIHHSVGRYIIRDGGLREKLANARPDLELWDHDYNKIGTRDANSGEISPSLVIPGDNTDPDGLREILAGFSRESDWTTSYEDFDYLILKSCYPNNGIGSDADFDARISIYTDMKTLAQALSMKVVLVATPPLVTERTRPTDARRAMQVAEWCRVNWAGDGLAFADIFGPLAYRDGVAAGTLRLGYRRKLPFDSHPAKKGCEVAADVLVDTLRKL